MSIPTVAGLTLYLDEGGPAMSNIVLQMGMSIDGQVSGGPEVDVTGIPEHPDVVAQKLAWITKARAHAMGRQTYQDMSKAWPGSTNRYAQPMNDIPKVVFSKTITEAEATWPTTTIANGDLTVEIADLKAQPGGDVIVYGGYTFAQALARADLIDVYHLIIQPVALGSGHPLFKDLEVGRRLELVDAITYPDSTIITSYRRRDPAAS
jgi:dihydrofolate reductase